MSSVLQKKVQAGHGVPPSVKGMSDFWDDLQNQLRVWGEKVTGADIEPVIDDFSVIGPDVVSDRLVSQLAFVYSAQESPCLVALSLDETIAAQFGAARMGQSVEGFNSPSSLFLRLLCEDAAVSFWKHYTGFEDTDATEQPSDLIVEPAAINDQLEARLLQVNVVFDVGETPCQISLLFRLDHLVDLARQGRSYGANGPAARSRSRVVMGERVRTATITLDAVLERLSFTVGDCTRFEVGQVIPLPGLTPSQLVLAAETVGGNLDIGHGEMGVWKNQRALKLNTPILESFVSEVAEL